MNQHLQSIKAIFNKYMAMVPYTHPLELEDIGFIVLRSICEANGSILIDQQIFVGEKIIGDQVNYRFDGQILNVAYRSLLQGGKIVQRTIRV